MDTFRTFYFDHNIEIKYADLSKEHDELFNRYISVMELVSGIEQINQVFDYNVRALSDNYILNYNDYIVSRNTNREVDYITLNALFENIISSGRVLIDRVKIILEHGFDANIYIPFREKYVEEIYNNVFAYRFFYSLRNVCQHGGIVVSHKDGRYCFDLEQIKNIKHFSFSKTEEWDRIIQEIAENYKTEATICFTENLDRYVEEVFLQYYNFLCYINDYIFAICQNVRAVLDANPNYVCGNDMFKGLVVYKKEGEHAHVFSVDEDVFALFCEYKGKAKNRIESYRETFHVCK